MSDKPRMTRSEVHALYEKEVASIRALRAGGEHQQGISMAMNEARRWLDRELDLAVPDPVEPAHKTLGALLRENIQEAERLRLDRDAAASRELREKAERRRQEVFLAIQELQSRIARSINEGLVLKPMRLPRTLNDARRYDTSIAQAHHGDHAQWCREMVAWADAQGLDLQVISDHDGAGMESWWSLVVKPR
jgi:hypothetical protein